MVRALEEPFYRAEMHRVDMSLPDKKGVNLKLVEGCHNKAAAKCFEAAGPVRMKKISGKA